MASRNRNITIDQGANFSANVVAYVNSSSSVTMNLVNYSANAYIRASHYKLYGANSFNVWIANTTLGIVKIDLTSANTGLMKSGSYVYDVIVKENFGSLYKTRIVEGMATVKPGVSR